MTNVTRILFVDDEVRVLDSIRDMLRKRRARWDMRFVTGGVEALALLEKESFDVVVTDLRMPGVDGFRLLEYLRANHPRTVRLVLSGDPKKETALKVVPQAHRAIVKPCKAGELEGALESACQLNELISDDALRDTLGRIVDLPSMPHTYARLEQALADNRSTPASVGEILSGDIGLSANVLKIANSALFGTGHVVASVDHAVALLGTDVVRTIVLSEGVLGRRELPIGVRDFAQELHAHSHVVARVAAELALDPTSRRDAFATGMLHDIGRLVLALEAPVFGVDVKAGGSMSRTKESTLLEHARVGAYLLGLWGVPATMIQGVARHHDADESCSVQTQLVGTAEKIVERVAGDSRPDVRAIDEMLAMARDHRAETAANAAQRRVS